MPAAPENAKVLGTPVRSWLIVGAMLIVLVHLGLRVSMIPQYRTELGGVEHNAVHGTQKLLLDIPLYQDPERVPFDVIQYTPAFFAVCAFLGKLLGIAGDDARSVFLLGRAVALILTLLSGWVVYRICRTAGTSMWAAVLAAGLTFCAYTEHFYARPDALQSFASVTAVLFFVQWLRAPGPILLYACAAFAVLGFFAKQSGALLVVVPGLYLFLHGNWKDFGRYAGSVLCLLVVGTAISLIGTTPTILWKNVVQGLANGYSTMMWGELFEPRTYKYFIGWHLLGLLVLIQGFRSINPLERFFALAIPLAVAFGLITGLKSGSRLNYIHEGLTLIFIGTAVVLGSAKAFKWKTHMAWAFAFYGLIFMAFRTKSVMHWAGLDGPESARIAEYKADLAVRDVLVNELGLQPGDHVFITYRDYLEHLLVRQSVMTQKDILQFSTAPLFNYSHFHKAMRDGTVRYVISDDANKPVTILDSTYVDWRPIRTVEGRVIMARTSDH